MDADAAGMVLVKFQNASAFATARLHALAISSNVPAMSFWGRINWCALAAAVLLAVNGCSPMDSGSADEEKEPHYVLGVSRFNEMDWPGAIDAFGQSLEVNPHSAMAHYRLAQLFDDKQPDPASAIYHYRQYLKLSPDARNRDVIQQRIDSCKQQLASDVLQLPGTPGMQKQVDALVDQNHKLQTQVDQLNGVIKQWNLYYASVQAAKGNSVSPQNNFVAPAASPNPDDVTPMNGDPANSTAATSTTPTKPKPAAAKSSSTKPVTKSRTHVVVSGETLAGIARKYKVSLVALQSANPSITPKKLRAGQTLNIP